mgnify:CR=1 FL=1
MARITTKEYVAARQMKKNGDCIPGTNPEVQSPFVFSAKG